MPSGKLNHVFPLTQRNLRGTCFSLLAISVLVATISGRASADAANLPPACVQPDEGKMLAEGLSSNQSGVVSNDAYFDFRDERFDIRTFSAQAEHPTYRSHYCLRYEVENTSSKRIARLYWPLVNLRVSNFKAGGENRRARNMLRPSIREPWLEGTELFAFYDSKALSRVWQLPEDVVSSGLTKTMELPEKTQPTGLRTSLVPMSFDVKERLPDVAKIYAAKNLQAVSVLAYQQSTAPEKYVELSDSYISGKYKIVARSSAKFDGKAYTVSTTLDLSGPEEKKVEVKAPYLIAVAKARDSQGLIALVPEVSRQPLLIKKSSFTTELNYYAQQLGKNLPSLFLVKHPVTFSIEGDSECFLISTYSPFPVSFGLDLCDMDWKLPH